MADMDALRKEITELKEEKAKQEEFNQRIRDGFESINDRVKTLEANSATNQVSIH